MRDGKCTGLEGLHCLMRFWIFVCFDIFATVCDGLTNLQFDFVTYWWFVSNIIVLLSAIKAGLSSIKAFSRQLAVSPLFMRLNFVSCQPSLASFSHASF